MIILLLIITYFIIGHIILSVLYKLKILEYHWDDCPPLYILDLVGWIFVVLYIIITWEIKYINKQYLNPIIEQITKLIKKIK